MLKNLLAKRVIKLSDSTVINTLKHATTPGIISLAGGIPNAKLFPKKEVKKVIAEIVNTELDSVLQYSVTAGIPQLREEIALYYSKKWGKNITLENILITSGSQQGIDLLGKAFLDEGKDSIVVENPTYLVAISAFNTYSPKYITIQTNDGQPDLEKLEKDLKKNKQIKFIYAIPTFQNPTGGTWNLKTRKKVIQLIKKYGILFLEDDPYGEIYFDQEPPKSLTGIDKSGHTIYLGTFSKTLIPGLRVGFIIAQKDMIQTFTLIKQSMDLHSSGFSQLIVAKLLSQENFYENHLKKLRKYYKENAEHLLILLEKYLKNNVSWNNPEGGLFIWLKIKNMSCKNLFTKAIEKKVAFMPGYPFYANDFDEYTMRLTFSTANKKQMEDAIKRLKSCF